MSISDADFLAWLARDGQPRAYLVEAGYGYLDGSTLVEATRYMSLRGYISHALDTPAQTAYPDILTGIPTIQYSLDSRSVGEIEIANDGGVRDPWLRDFWDGRSLLLLVGDPSWPRADFRVLLSGTLAGIHGAGVDRLVLSLRDSAALLDVPVQPNLIASGPSKDRPIPLALGFCANVEPVWVPPATASPVLSVTLAYDAETGLALLTSASAHGRSVGDCIEVLGTTHPEYSGVFLVEDVPSSTTLHYRLDLVYDLVTDSGDLADGSLTYQVHAGEIAGLPDVRDNGVTVVYTADLTHGKFTLAAQPVGAIRADVRGAMFASAEIKTASAFVRFIFDQAGLSSGLLDDAALDDFATECPQHLGMYITDARNVADVVAEIGATLDAHFLPSRAGAFRFWRLAAPVGSAVRDVGANDIRLAEVEARAVSVPVYKLTMGYQRNWAVQDAGSLAGSVIPARRTAYSTEYLKLSTTASAVKTRHPLAVDLETIDTLFADVDPAVSQGHCQDEIDRRMALYGVIRTTYSATVSAMAMALNLLDEVGVTYPRFEFEAGENAVITGIEEQPSEDRVILELWR